MNGKEKLISKMLKLNNKDLAKCLTTACPNAFFKTVCSKCLIDDCESCWEQFLSSDQTNQPYKVIEYNKLVRDKIPAIIEKEGNRCDYISLTNDRMYYYSLINKLEEELKELEKASNINEILEEVADVLEVLENVKQFVKVGLDPLIGFNEEDLNYFDNYINKVLQHNNISEKELKKAQNKKNIEKGTYKNRVYLLKVYKCKKPKQ